MKRLIFIILILTINYSHVHPQEGTEKHLIDDINLHVVIYGPGDELFIWWGHVALIVEYTLWDISQVFDWGVLDYPSNSFINALIRDEVRYKVTEGFHDLQEYINANRDVTVYTLNLDRKAKETILSYAVDMTLPENCYYDYHDFRDNCSTRIRDIIDLGLRGQFKAAYGNVPGRLSYRQHARRFTWSKPASEWLLSFLCGQNLDKKITAWEEMFLPVEVARNIVDFTYHDDSGMEKKLVSSVEKINSSKMRPAILKEPARDWPFAFVAGLICACLLFFLQAQVKKNSKLCRILLNLSQSILGLFFGILGCFLFFCLCFVRIDYFHSNYNILFVNPFILVIVPLGVLASTNKTFLINPERCLQIIWTYIFITCLIIFVLHLFPSYYQQNMSILGIILPVSFVLSNVAKRTYNYWLAIGSENGVLCTTKRNRCNCNKW